MEGGLSSSMNSFEFNAKRWGIRSGNNKPFVSVGLACERDECKSGIKCCVIAPALLNWGGSAATAVQMTRAALHESVASRFYL